MSRQFTMTKQERRVAFYDFAVSPTSYDFATYMLLAVAFTKHLHVVFVPGDFHGFREDHKPISIAERRFRVEHILIPLCTAFGATYTLCETREQATQFYSDSHYPIGYNINEPFQMHTVAVPLSMWEQGVRFRWPQPTERALQLVHGMFTAPPIVITLRECYIAERNSDMGAWMKFYRAVRNERPVVFVRDTDKWNEPFDAPTCQAAAIDMDIRLALYQIAHVNLGINNGPMALNTYSARPYIAFKFWNEATPTTSRMLEKWGMKRGSQLPWATERQRIVWEGDDYDTLMAEYRRWEGAPALEEAA